MKREYMKACDFCQATGFVSNPHQYVSSALTITCPICNGNKTVLVTETFDSLSPVDKDDLRRELILFESRYDNRNIHPKSGKDLAHVTELIKKQHERTVDDYLKSRETYCK